VGIFLSSNSSPQKLSHCNLSGEKLYTRIRTEIFEGRSSGIIVVGGCETNAIWDLAMRVVPEEARNINLCATNTDGPQLWTSSLPTPSGTLHPTASMEAWSCACAEGFPAFLDIVE
jgi:hypothetical protein